jgi:SOS response regulatory protein OraA/RecX
MVSKQSASNHDSRRALALARRYVRFGTRSTAEVRTYLQQQHVPQRLIERLIADWSREGLLDDRACAKLLATHLADRGYAWATIHEQLLAKGLDQDLVTQVIAPLEARADDATRARALVVQLRGRRREHRPRNLPASRRSAQAGRVARFLAQRGFDSELIDRVLTESFGPDNTV